MATPGVEEPLIRNEEGRNFFDEKSEADVPYEQGSGTAPFHMSLTILASATFQTSGFAALTITQLV